MMKDSLQAFDAYMFAEIVIRVIMKIGMRQVTCTQNIFHIRG